MIVMKINTLEANTVLVKRNNCSNNSHCLR